MDRSPARSANDETHLWAIGRLGAAEKLALTCCGLTTVPEEAQEGHPFLCETPEWAHAGGSEKPQFTSSCVSPHSTVSGSVSPRMRRRAGLSDEVEHRRPF